VVRGGSWGNFPVNLRVSTRDWSAPGFRFNGVGFRLVQDMEP
jgi:formylglycine-generating enzyme required for sulfatase activity